METVPDPPHRSRTGALILDGDACTAEVLEAALGARGYEVVHVADVPAALRVVANAEPQVIVIGDELPDFVPITAVVMVRARTTAPIIVLSGRVEPGSEIRALDAGADGYVEKPFDLDEFLARVRAAVRRAAVLRSGARQGIVDTGSFTVDMDARKVWRDGAEVHLSPTEWRVLETLVSHEGTLVSQRELLRAVWGGNHDTDTHYVRIYMRHLRRKLEPDPARPRHLTTEPNRGYRFHARRAGAPAETLT